MSIQVRFVSGSRRSCNTETEIEEGSNNGFGQIRSSQQRSVNSRSQSCRIRIRLGGDSIRTNDQIRSNSKAVSGSIKLNKRMNQGLIRSDSRSTTDSGSMRQSGFSRQDGGITKTERLRRTETVTILQV